MRIFRGGLLYDLLVMALLPWRAYGFHHGLDVNDLCVLRPTQDLVPGDGATRCRDDDTHNQPRNQ